VVTSIQTGGSTIGGEPITLELFPLVAKPFAEICGSVSARMALAPAFAPSTSALAAPRRGLF
jgi:hypothetical protein